MAKEKPQTRHIGSIIILLLVVVSAFLVIAEVSTNVINEMISCENLDISALGPKLISTPLPAEPTPTLLEMLE